VGVLYHTFFKNLKVGMAISNFGSEMQMEGLYIRDLKYNNRDYLCKDYISGQGLANPMIDERRDDGVDNDADWDPNTDDVGLDGKSGTGDFGEGDTLNLYPEFPFTGNSRYQFKVKGQRIDQAYAARNLDKIKVVPNPYVVTASWERSNPYSSGRGPRSVQFIHLPQRCTIRIFAVDGTLVRTLEHDAPMSDGSEEWNLLTRDNMDLAYGVYVYHIQAPGVGEKTGRILISK